MPSDTPTPVAILAAHDYIAGVSSCPCGWHWTETRTYACGEDLRIARAYNDHLIAALSEHYHLLPKAGGQVVVGPVEYSLDPHALTVKWADEQVLVTKGKGVVRLYVEDHRYTPDDARELGAALLAAADVAEEPK